MLQAGREPDLLEEALGPEHRGELRMQHLDRHPAMVPHVLGQVDRRHAAGAERTLEPVPAGERARQPRQLRGAE